MAKLSNKALEAKIREYEEYKAILEEAEKQKKALEEELKKELERRKVSELEVGGKTVRYTVFTQKRFDSAGFKKANPDVYSEWQKEVQSSRFSVA